MGFVPDWLQGVINTMQVRADAKYEDEVKLYQAAAQDWITANVINRDIGQPVTVFTRPVPARVVFGTDENGNLMQTSETDPNVLPPVLPPPVPKQAATPFVTGAPAQSDAIGETLKLVRQIAAYFPAVPGGAR